MACDEYERRILDLFEGQLPSWERTAVESHLAGCPACQALARQLRQLDKAIGFHIKTPALSSGFEARLRRRIQAETPVMSQSQRVERKRQIQVEYEAGLKLLHNRAAWNRTLLDLLGCGALIALGGWLIWQFAPELTQLMTRQGLNSFSANLLFSSFVSAILLIACLWVVFKSRFARMQISRTHWRR